MNNSSEKIYVIANVTLNNIYFIAAIKHVTLQLKSIKQHRLDIISNQVNLKGVSYAV